LPYFEPARKFDQGFAHYDNENARLHARAGVGDARGWSAQEQTNKAITFLANNRARRWFLWVHYFEPHYRYERHPMSATFGESERDLYDGEIRFTDDEVGRLLGYLRERGLFDNTIIVVTSDHGEGFGEHGVEFHARHLYAAQTRVPMLLRVPGRSPQRISTPIGHIDLSPTLLDIIGEPSPSDWMGRSVTSALDGGDEKRVIFQQLSLGKGRETRGAASDKCHVLYHIRPDATWEVYRVDIDPAEMIDRSDDPTVCADTRRALEAWCEQGCD
ncbi:MAG: sulfatase, partial [Thermomicrobiales bacterium]